MRLTSALMSALLFLPHTGPAEAVEGGSDPSTGSVIARSVVAVYDPVNSRLCTGVLISRTAVLTAAHCGGAQPISIIFETHVAGHLTEGPLVPVSLFRPSPVWAHDRDKPWDRGDLAVAILDRKAPSLYRPATLVEVGEGAAFWRRQAGAILAGYGTTSYRQETGGRLHQAQLASRIWEWSVTELLARDERVAACDGDSGAPLFLRLPTGELGVSALVSRSLLTHASQLCSHRFGMTKLAPYRTWIDDVLASHGAEPVAWVQDPTTLSATQQGTGMATVGEAGQKAQ